MRKAISMLLVLVLIISLSGCDLITGGKKDDDPSVDAAEELLDDGDISDAIDMLEDLVKDDEEDWEAWELLVQAYIEDEEFEDAADALADMGKAIEDNYDEDDDDIADAMDTYTDLAEEIMDEDDEIEITAITSIVSGSERPDRPDEPDTPDEPETPDEPDTPDEPINNRPEAGDISVEAVQWFFDHDEYNEAFDVMSEMNPNGSTWNDAVEVMYDALDASSNDGDYEMTLDMLDDAVSLYYDMWILDLELWEYAFYFVLDDYDDTDIAEEVLDELADQIVDMYAENYPDIEDAIDAYEVWRQELISAGNSGVDSIESILSAEGLLDGPTNPGDNGEFYYDDYIYVHGINLYPGQYSVNIYEDGSYYISFFVALEDFEYEMDVSPYLSESEIMTALNEQVVGDGEVFEVIKNVNGIYFGYESYTYDITGDYDIVGDYPTYYSDYADYFYNYNTGGIMSSADFEQIPHAMAMYIDSNYMEGVWYHFPFPIIAVEDSDYYTYWDEYTIFVGPDYWGEIVLDGEFY